jgi:hypothetical protein
MAGSIYASLPSRASTNAQPLVMAKSHQMACTILYIFYHILQSILVEHCHVESPLVKLSKPVIHAHSHSILLHPLRWSNEWRWPSNEKVNKSDQFWLLNKAPVHKDKPPVRTSHPFKLFSEQSFSRTCIMSQKSLSACRSSPFCVAEHREINMENAWTCHPISDIFRHHISISGLLNANKLPCGWRPKLNPPVWQWCTAVVSAQTQRSSKEEHEEIWRTSIRQWG